MTRTALTERPWTGPLSAHEARQAHDTILCGACQDRALWTWYAVPSEKMTALMGTPTDVKIGFWTCPCGWRG